MNVKLTLLALSVAASAPAMATLGEANGFSGEISVITGYASGESNLDTESSANLTSLNAKPESEDGFLAAPLGSVAYTFGSRSEQQFYAGTTREDIAVGTVALQLGYKYLFPSRMQINLSYLPTVIEGEAWQNPYDTVNTRTETDVKGNAYRMEINNVAGSLLSFDLAYADKEVENDFWQGTYLDRNGSTYQAKAKVRVPISRSTMLMPSITYQRHNADGEANAKKTITGELSLFQSFGPHQFALTGSYGSADYDGANALFGGETRNEDMFSFFLAYEYQQFLGWQNTSFIAFAGYDSSDANIDFYDTKSMITSIGLSYRF